MATAICWAFSVVASAATTFVVNSPSDDLGFDVGNGVCETEPGNGVCTLRRAIAETSVLFPLFPRTFQPREVVTIVIGTSGAPIVLAPGAPPLGVAGEGDLAIVGAGLGTTVVDANGGWAFDFTGSANKTVRMSGLTVRNASYAVLGNGTLTLEYVKITQSVLGLWWAGTEATLVGCEISANGSAAGGGGIYSTSPAVGPDANLLRIRNSILTGNTSSAGGAIGVAAGTVLLEGVTLSNNRSTSWGGAVFVSESAALKAVNTTFSGNAAAQSGGAVAVAGGTARLVHTTLTDNQADDDMNGVGVGGAIAVTTGQSGRAGVITLDHDILAGNRKTAFAGSWTPVAGECFGPVHATGPTLFDLVDCTVTGVAPTVGQARLGPLQDNGGLTPTHRLMSSSAAIDAGETGPCHDADGAPLAIDQRGFSRPAGAACDLGAFERNAVAPVKARQHDLDGDGRADLLWRHDVNGSNATWLMDGGTITAGVYLPMVPDVNWDIAASDDFDGDGHADLLWRNAATGDVAVWLMDGTTPRFGGWLPDIEDPAWRVAGTGDFDGDGRADILWQQADGRSAVWLVDGTALKGAVRLPPFVGWTVAGVADADADGRSDILWHNPSTGDVMVWLMDGATLSSIVVLPEVAASPWQVEAYADLNADDQADVVWRNAETGEMMAWLVSGGSVWSQPLPTVDVDAWSVALAADTDGDSRTDLIWRASNGQNARWRMDGLTIESPEALTTVADVDWEIR
jgi:hypothetical protein